MPLSRRHTRNSNPRPDARVGTNGGNVVFDGGAAAAAFDNFQDELRRLVREAWPNKTAQHLAAIGGITLRQAERILAREHNFSSAVQFNLYWCEFGERFHWALMSHVDGSWCESIRRQRRLAMIREQRAALDREEKELGA